MGIWPEFLHSSMSFQFRLHFSTAQVKPKSQTLTLLQAVGSIYYRNLTLFKNIRKLVSHGGSIKRYSLCGNPRTLKLGSATFMAGCTTSVYPFALLCRNRYTV